MNDLQVLNLSYLENIPQELFLATSEDSMKASIRCPVSVLFQIDTQQIIHLLDSVSICHGIDKVSIEKQIQSFRESSSNSSSANFKSIEVHVAQGSKPVLPCNGSIEIMITEKPEFLLDQHGKTDFRNINKFKQIEEGTLLAKRIPPIEGKSGFNIYGEEILSPPPIDARLKCGTNVKFIPETNEYRSLAKGIFHREENQISIHTVLLVPKNVGMKSGNIIYEGDIQINENIEHGASVSSLGSLTVKGIIESENVRISSSLDVGSGINTAGKGSIRIDGNLKTIYLDNTSVIVGKNAFLLRSITSSRLIVHNNLYMTSGTSAIIGGRVTVFGSLATDQIGNMGGTRTIIELGVHYWNIEYYRSYLKIIAKEEKHYEFLRKQVLDFKEYLQRQRAKTMLQANKKKAYLLYKEYQEKIEDIKKLRESARQYKSNRLNQKPLTLVVRKVIHPGVEICYHSYRKLIVTPIQRVVMSFSPYSAKPLIRSYSPGMENKIETFNTKWKIK